MREVAYEYMSAQKLELMNFTTLPYTPTRSCLQFDALPTFSFLDSTKNSYAKRCAREQETNGA